MSTAGKKPTAAEVMDGLKAVLYHVLAKFAGKEANREKLEEGSKTLVRCKITAEVNGRTIEQEINGHLVVGHDTPSNSSSGPKQEVVLAYALEKMPENTRNSILRKSVTELEANEPSKESILATKQFLERLRRSTPVTKKGNVAFVEDAA